MTLTAIFTENDRGTVRMVGYATVPYSSNSQNETAFETTKEVLSAVFEDAKANGETLNGSDASIDAAVEDPLAYRDYLVLEDGEIVFDPEHTREDK